MRQLVEFMKMVWDLSRSPGGEQTIRTTINLIWSLVILGVLPSLLAILILFLK